MMASLTKDNYHKHIDSKLLPIRGQHKSCLENIVFTSPSRRDAVHVTHVTSCGVMDSDIRKTPYLRIFINVLYALLTVRSERSLINIKYI